MLGHAQPADPAVSVRIRSRPGAVNDPSGKDGLATFTARMLPRGTARRTFEQLNEATDGLGASLGVEPGRHFAEIAVRCLREDLPALLDLAAEILREPVFPLEEIEKVRNEMLTGVREADNDTRATADRTLRRLLYPAPHPLGRRVAGEIDTLTAISRDDLVAYHAAQLRCRRRHGCGRRRFRAVRRLGREWSGRARRLDRPRRRCRRPITPPAPPAARWSRRSSIPAKSQSDLAIGWPTLPRLDPAYYAFDTANLILGRLGLMGRLGANVRDKQGLAYYVFSQSKPGGRGASGWPGRGRSRQRRADRGGDRGRGPRA